MDTEIVLITKTPGSTLDSFLQPITTETRMPVLATDVPISRSEYYQAGENGIRPEFMFVINPIEYSGEEEVEVTFKNGLTRRFGIYRTYERNPDELEVYCKQATGLNEKPEPEPTPDPKPEPEEPTNDTN